MRWAVPVCALLGALLLPAPPRPVQADDKTDDGFKPLFNGKDLKGWVPVNNAVGTFYAFNNEIVTTGVPLGYMRTDRMYENFILELDWMHLPPKPGAVGNSGVFVWADPLPAVGSAYTRGIEVQVLVNLTLRDKKTGQITATSQGDLFSIWGATCVPDRPHPLGWARCLPSEDRAKGAGEWNHYRVEAKDGVITLAVNGKVVSGVSKCVPRKGYLGLEAEGSECHFRNLKIKELPSSNPTPKEVCQQSQGFRTLFDGMNLNSWQLAGGQKDLWAAQPQQNILVYKGDKPSTLATVLEYGDFELVCDVRPAGKEQTLTFLPRGNRKLALDLSKAEAGKWTRFVIHCKGDKAILHRENRQIAEKTATREFLTGPIQFETTGPVSLCNIFLRDLK